MAPDAPITWTELGGIAVILSGFVWLTMLLDKMKKESSEGRERIYKKIDSVIATMMPRTEIIEIVRRIDGQIAEHTAQLSDHAGLLERRHDERRQGTYI